MLINTYYQLYKQMYFKKSSLMNLTLQRLFRFSRRMIPMTKPFIPKLVCFHLFVRYFITESKNAEADLRLLQHPKMERFVIIVPLHLACCSSPRSASEMCRKDTISQTVRFQKMIFDSNPSRHLPPQS